MSKVDSLNEKVEKAELKVEKCKGTIERHEKALVKKIVALEKKVGEGVKDLEALKWDSENGRGSEHYWEVCDIERKQADIKGAKKKLAEAEKILSNWKEKLNLEMEKDRFIEGNAPQVIKDFLEQWKQMAYEWHIKKYESFLIFKKDLYEQEAKAIKECPYTYYKDRRNFMEEKGLDNIDKRLMNFAGATVMQMATYRDEEERLAWLGEVLEQEKKRKMLDLINRINDVVGSIVDAKGLSVGKKLDLNGVIIGEKANARVETIGAGGWNIVCFHYRTLVHKMN